MHLKLTCAKKLILQISSSVVIKWLNLYQLSSDPAGFVISKWGLGISNEPSFK